MTITCPHCNFSRQADPARVPDGPVKVKCPKCTQAFSFNKAELTSEAATQVEQVTCPACGLVQAKADHCLGCGVIYEKFKGRQQQQLDEEPFAEHAARQEDLPVPPISAAHKDKAGFWIRVVATLLDSFLMGVVQFILSLIIGLVIGGLGFAVDGDPAVSMIIWLFGVSLSIGYAVFFLGYCGQTPGKMALRIKVIRTDGSPISYGRAALREVPGKFLSSILLGIGYLMVAFDREKQGLHDKIAGTYVIKL